MRPQAFSDVAAAVALFRPGPMINIPRYVARKQAREPSSTCTSGWSRSCARRTA